MAFVFSEQDKKKLAEIRSHYPDARAATLPALHYAQDLNGFVSEDVIDQVASELDLPRAHVLHVATFYTMYNKKPVGRFHIQVCTNIACSLLGARHLVQKLEEELGISPGDTSEDGMFTLTEVECLGSCGTAPMMQVNDSFYEDLTEQKLLNLIDAMRKGEIDG